MSTSSGTAVSRMVPTDTEVFKQIVLIKDDIGIEASRLHSKTGFEAHTL